MERSSSWSKVLALHASQVPATDYLATLLALRPASVRLSLARIVQHERQDALKQLESLGIPSPVAGVLIALSASDPSFASLSPILDAAIDDAARSKLGTAVRIETAEPLTSSTKAAILGSLHSRFPEPMVIDTSVNPLLLGGGRVQVGSVRIDLSTKTQLTRLRQVVQS